MANEYSAWSGDVGRRELFSFGWRFALLLGASSNVPRSPPGCDRPTECQFVMDDSWTGGGYAPSVARRDGTIERGKNGFFETRWHCTTCGKTWSEMGGL
jgi:hypothetical protein